MCISALTHKGRGKGVVSNKQGFEPHVRVLLIKLEQEYTKLSNTLVQ